MDSNRINEQRLPQTNLAACLLPWNERDELDVSVFEEHIEDVITSGYRSLYVMGTAGEGYAVTERVFREVVEVFAAHTLNRELEPQIGIISMSMKQVYERIETAREFGFTMFQISLPSWGALDEIETLDFFKSICGEFPDCRFLHYNLPRVKKLVDGSEYRRICDEVPNLVATKNSSNDYGRTEDLMNHAPHLQHFFVNNFAMGCTLGRCSLLSSYSVLFPKLIRTLYEEGLAQNHSESFRITRFLAEVRRVLLGHCTRRMIDGSIDKTFARLRNPRFSNRLLPPYIGLSEAEFAICRKAFEHNYVDIE